MSIIHKTIWLLSLLPVLLLSGCTDNDGIENSTIGQETVVDFKFGDCSFKRVDIKTRATLGIARQQPVCVYFRQRQAHLFAPLRQR